MPARLSGGIGGGAVSSFSSETIWLWPDQPQIRVMKILPLRILILLAATGSLLLSSCIEQSTVIKVKPDGSGIIHERNYSGASDDVISLPSLSGKKKAAEEEPKLPSEAALKQYASTLGAGVTFKSVKASINKKGWKGYEILYEFKDINTVRYARKTPKPESGDNEGDDKMKRNDDGFTATFAKVGGKLSIKVDRDSFGKTDQAAVQQPNSPTIDPYADTTAPSPAQMTLSSPVMNEVMMKAIARTQVILPIAVPAERPVIAPPPPPPMPSPPPSERCNSATPISVNARIR